MRDVAFSCDDNGAKFLRVTVWSLLKHYKGAEPVRINVFEGFGGHSAANKAKLAEVVSEFSNASVRYHDVEKAIAPYADLIMGRAGSRWNVFTWTPVFTPLLLDDATGNVAHFDIDMLFNDDVAKILDLDLGDNLIAAVAEYGKGDPVITEAVWGKGILPPEAERYFNTGTIVFNAAKCREERTWEKILAWYKEHYDIADRIEQDAWNALYWKRTKLLPLRWNFHDRLVKRYPDGDLRHRYWQGNPPQDCFEAALHPAILHFWGPKKPWKPCHRPYRKLYHEAMRAVGETPPREQVFGWWHDLRTQRDLRKIAEFLQILRDARNRDSEAAQARVEDYFRRQRRWKSLRRQMLTVPAQWLAIVLGVLVIAPLPRRGMQTVVDFAGFVYWLFDRRGRQFAEDNLQVVFGDGRNVPKRRTDLIIRRSYCNMARSVGHALWTCVNARARAEGAGEVSARTRAFLSKNRPAVTVSGHIGCWEILSQLALLEGHAMMSVAKDIGTPAMTRLLMRARRSIGQEIVPAAGAFKALLGGIRSGKSLGLLVDQRVGPADGGVWVRFFGRPFPVSAAPAFFAAKAKVPIIVAWSRPLPDGRYRCEFADEIGADEAHDIWRVTQRCTADLERIIRRHPSCWVLNYDYFCLKPGEKDLVQLLEREARG